MQKSKPRWNRDLRSRNPQGGRSREKSKWLSAVLLAAMLAGPARGQLTVGIDHMDGRCSAGAGVCATSAKYPFAFTLEAGYATRSDDCYDTALGNGSQNVSVRTASYRWIVSAAGTDEYLLQTSGGADPSIGTPTSFTSDGHPMKVEAAGSLGPGTFALADNDALGYTTIYYRHFGAAGTDPDTLATDYLIAGYGQAAQWGLKPISTCSYVSSTKTLTCTNGFDKYSKIAAEDMVRLSHAGVSGGTPQWVEVASKSSDDALVLVTDWAGGDLTSAVTIRVPVWPFHHVKYMWTLTGAKVYFDPRPGSSSPGTTFHGPTALPLYEAAGSYTATVVATGPNGETDSESISITVNDWTNATEFFISNSGNDGNDGLTGGTAKRTWTAGWDQFWTNSDADGTILNVADGFTDTLTADVTPAANKGTPRLIRHNGTGTRPVISANNGAKPYDTDDTSTFGDSTNHRLVGLEFDGAGTLDDGVEWIASRSLIWNVVAHDFDYQFDIEGAHLAMVECTADATTHTGKYGIFAGGDLGYPNETLMRGRSYVGNHFTGSANDACARIVNHHGANYYNTFMGKDVNVGLRIFWPDGWIGSYARFAEVSWNYIRHDASNFGAQCVWHTAQTTARGIDDELFEGNFFEYAVDAAGAATAQGISFGTITNPGQSFRRMTIRNNIFDGCDVGASVDNAGQIDFFGNTVYDVQTNTNSKFGIDVNGSGGCVLLRAVNNLVYTTSSGGSPRAFRNSGTGVTAVDRALLIGNVTRNASSFCAVGTGSGTTYTTATWATAKAASPFFCTDAPNDKTITVTQFDDAANDDFDLAPGVLAIDFGIENPLAPLDYKRVSRTGAAWDAGAVSNDGATGMGPRAFYHYQMRRR